MQQPSLPFHVQRLVCIAPVLGAVLFAIVVGVILQGNDGRGFAVEPMPDLDTVIVAVGGVLLIGGLMLRAVLHGRADATEHGPARSLARFRARLVPIAILEGGALLGLVGWLLTGAAVPNLVVALVLIAAQIAILPLHDVDDRA